MFKPETEPLIERCRSGDEEAVSLLVKDNQAALFRLALSILDDPAEADEATQETFLAALRNLGSYRGGASLRTWLFAIAINVCRSRLRRRRSWRRVQTSVLGALTGGDRGAQPETVGAHHEHADKVLEGVQGIGAKDPLPPNLRYFPQPPVYPESPRVK